MGKVIAGGSPLMETTVASAAKGLSALGIPARFSWISWGGFRGGSDDAIDAEGMPPRRSAQVLAARLCVWRPQARSVRRPPVNSDSCALAGRSMSGAGNAAAPVGAARGGKEDVPLHGSCGRPRPG